MAAAPEKSLKPFWIVFAVIAVGGGAVIARGAMKGGPPLTTDTIAPMGVGPRGVTMGSDSAPVEVIELSDFECPWCGRFAVLNMPDLKQRLISTGKVRWRFVNYPLSMHQKGPYAHLAASCANEQGRFWEMHDLIYQNQSEWSESSNPLRDLEGYARQAGVEMTRYQSCITERRTWGQVLADKAFGDSIAPGSGTPTFFLNGRMLRNVPSADELARIADSVGALAPAGRARASR